MQPLHDLNRLNVTQMLEQDREVALHIDRVGFDEIFVGQHYASAFQPITDPLQFLASIIRPTQAGANAVSFQGVSDATSLQYECTR